MPTSPSKTLGPPAPDHAQTHRPPSAADGTRAAHHRRRAAGAPVRRGAGQRDDCGWHRRAAARGACGHQERQDRGGAGDPVYRRECAPDDRRARTGGGAGVHRPACAPRTAAAAPRRHERRAAGRNLGAGGTGRRRAVSAGGHHGLGRRVGGGDQCGLPGGAQHRPPAGDGDRQPGAHGGGAGPHARDGGAGDARRRVRAEHRTDLHSGYVLEVGRGACAGGRGRARGGDLHLAPARRRAGAVGRRGRGAGDWATGADPGGADTSQGGGAADVGAERDYAADGGLGARGGDRRDAGPVSLHGGIDGV